MGMRLPPETERRVLELAAQAATEPHRLGVAPMSEKAFQTAVVALARREGWRCFHPTVSKGSVAGFPDLTMVHPARGLVFAELKVPGNEPTAAQLNWLEDLRAAGARAFLWMPADWSEVERVLRGA